MCGGGLVRGARGESRARGMVTKRKLSSAGNRRAAGAMREGMVKGELGTVAVESAGLSL